MTRTPGSKEARVAWLHLRGWYFLAYLAYFSLAYALQPDEPSRDTDPWWMWIATFIGAALMVGSIGSFLIISSRERHKFCYQIESIEVSALRVGSIFEILFAPFSLVVRERPVYIFFVHLFMGFMFLGILANLTWHRSSLNVNK